MSGSQYRAVFTDTSGLTATTTAATLTVLSAPVVTTNPAAQTASAGATASFMAAAGGTPAPTVQWRVSTDGSTWNNVSGATATTYSFTVTTAANGYQYRAVFTNSQGTATTSAARLTVVAMPVVTTNPTSQSVVVGTTVNFTAAANGASTTQWQLSTNGGGVWNSISGATAATYSVTATATMSGYQYRVLFTNASGSATSSAATLTVGTPITITSNPQSTAVAAGTSVTFTTSAIGSPVPTVQWQVSSDHAATWTNVAGATATSYAVTATAAISGYEYRAVFNSVFGTAATSPATLTISAAPAITANPTNQAVAAGATANFTASASGATSTQWQLSTNGGSTWTNIVGATAASYSVTTSATMSGYQYRVLFSSPSGSATTSAATLTVGTPITITSNPQSKSVAANASVTFTTSAVGSPAPTVQWQVSSDHAATWTNIAGATATSYTVTASAAISGYEYRAVFNSVFGTAATSPATLTITSSTPLPTITANPLSQTVAAGATVNFTSSSTGATATQWQLSTNGGSTWTNIASATTTSYSFTAAAAMSGYKYRVQYTNAAGSVLTLPATLTVSAQSAMPVVTTNPASQSAVVGQNVSFTAAATAASTPTVQWQASFNGTTWVNISGATSTTYTLTVAATQNGYYFRAVFTNSSGFVATTAARLTVTAAAGAKQVKTVAAPAGINVTSTPTSAVKTSLNAAAVDAVMVRI